jgi:hypothetical protein
LACKGAKVRFIVFGLLLIAHNAFAQEWSWDWMRFGSNGQTLFFDRLVLKKRNLNEYSVNLKYKNNPCFDKAQVDNLNYENETVSFDVVPPAEISGCARPRRFKIKVDGSGGVVENFTNNLFEFDGIKNNLKFTGDTPINVLVNGLAKRTPIDIPSPANTEGSGLAQLEKHNSQEVITLELQQKEQVRRAQEAKLRDQEKLLADQRAKEEQRLAEDARSKEQQKLALAAQQKEQLRIAQEAKLREQEKLLADQKAKEEQRLAEDARVKEQQKLALEAQQKEQSRLAQEAKQREQDRLIQLGRIKELEAVAESARAKDLELAKLKEELASMKGKKEAASAAAVTRKALVIGNDNYSSVSKLVNARQDANAVGKSLTDLGYKVTVKNDLNEKDMKAVLRQFKNELEGGDEVVLFYAGHGIQIGSTNYLLPIDIKGESEDQVRDDAIQLQRLLDDMNDRKVKLTLAVIDACRDNPFPKSGRAIGTRGLAPTTAATGQMIIFSAGTGQQALDKLGPGDKNPNGLFTRMFLSEMKTPGVRVDNMIRDVRRKVVEAAKSVGHEQVPAIYDQVVGDFYFNK